MSRDDPSNPSANPADRGTGFLPEDYVRGKGERRANLLSVFLFGVVMFGVVGAFFVTNRRWLDIRAQQESINLVYRQQTKRIEQLVELEKQQVEMVSKAEVTASLVERVPRSVLMAQLVQRMPADVTLLGVNLESEKIKAPKASAPADAAKGVRSLTSSKKSKKSKKTVEEPAKPEPARYKQRLSMEGVALTNDVIADYIESLRSCSILESVELQYIKQSKIDDALFRKFVITARISPDADARGLEFEHLEDQSPVLPRPDDIINNPVAGVPQLKGAVDGPVASVFEALLTGGADQGAGANPGDEGGN